MTTFFFFLPSVAILAGLVWLLRDIELQQARREAARLAALRRRGVITVHFEIDTKPFVDAMARAAKAAAVTVQRMNEVLAANPSLREALEAEAKRRREIGGAS